MDVLLHKMNHRKLWILRIGKSRGNFWKDGEYDFRSRKNELLIVVDRPEHPKKYWQIFARA
jgi:hypothetical protein